MAERVVRNAVSLLDDASLLATYQRYATATTLSVFSLEEAGKVVLKLWGEPDRLRVVDRKWTWHIRKQTAATSLLQAEVANRTLQEKFAEWGVKSQAECNAEQFQDLREHLAKALYESRERRLLEYVAVGATERMKHIGLYVDEWSSNNGFNPGSVSEDDYSASVHEARRAIRLLRDPWLIEVAKAIYLTSSTKSE